VASIAGDLMESTELVVLIALLFGISYCLLSLLFLVGRKATQPQFEKRIHERLTALMTSNVTSEGTKLQLLRERYRNEVSWVDRLILRIPGLEEKLDHVDYFASILRIRFLVLGSLFLSPLIFHILFGVTESLFFSFSGAFTALSFPYLYLNFATKRKVAEIESQLPEALESITRALRAGYPFSDTIRMISEEFPPPLGSEFRILFEEVNAGIELRVALAGLVSRVPSVSMMAFTTSVLLQRETGGNLSETLSKISQIIRKRFNFQRNVRTLTAEGRMSGWVLALLPIVLYGFMYLMDPTYAGVLIFDPEGRKVALAGFGMLGLGILWIRQIIEIEV